MHSVATFHKTPISTNKEGIACFCRKKYRLVQNDSVADIKVSCQLTVLINKLRSSAYSKQLNFLSHNMSRLQLSNTSGIHINFKRDSHGFHHKH